MTGERKVNCSPSVEQKRKAYRESNESGDGSVTHEGII
jgi:hypothetical protein